MKVEQALSVIPDLEALAPLRALLLSASRADERTRWASAARYLTVAKRRVQAGDLRDRLEDLLGTVTAHIRELYLAVIEAMDARERGDDAGAIAALCQAGALEERAGRLQQAKTWYEAALDLAARHPDRGPELELLRALSALCRSLGRYGEASRHCQRCLALAEAEFSEHAVLVACEELGNIAREQGDWQGAHAWYERGLRLDRGDGSSRGGWLLLGLGDVARGRGDTRTAVELLGRARERLESAADAAGVAQVLSAQGQVDISLGRLGSAQAAYREALAWARRGAEPEKLEVDIRLRLAELALESGRWLEAESDLRLAEQAALAHHLPRRLVEIYIMMGRLSGRGGEDTGFVFFEQALELCRALDLEATLTADVCVAYGQFHGALGNPDASRAYLERALETYETAGQAVALDRVRRELWRLGHLSGGA